MACLEKNYCDDQGAWGFKEHSGHGQVCYQLRAQKHLAEHVVVLKIHYLKGVLCLTGDCRDTIRDRRASDRGIQNKRCWVSMCILKYGNGWGGMSLLLTSDHYIIQVSYAILFVGPRKRSRIAKRRPTGDTQAPCQVINFPKKQPQQHRTRLTSRQSMPGYRYSIIFKAGQGQKHLVV